MSADKPGRSGLSDPHRFIVFQYGKVGSTSVTAALNALPGCEAHQTHFLGREAFANMLQLLLDPARPEYFFEHSAGQLIENLRIYRHFNRRHMHNHTVTVISIAREPFDWFRSALTQDAAQHVTALKGMLDARGIHHATDGEALGEGLRLVFALLQDALQHFGSLDDMAAGKRYQLRDVIDQRGDSDFKTFMFFVNIFMRPHLWYRSQFSALFDFGLGDMTAVGSGALRREEPWGNTYILQYEQLEAGMQCVMSDLGYGGLCLPRENVTLEKPLAREISAAFSSAEAAALKRLCHSEDTRLLGYPAPA